jgi:hypothetical protein
VCSWLGIGCCWVETRGWGPKTGLGGSRRGPGGSKRSAGGREGVKVGVVGPKRGSKRELGGHKRRLGVQTWWWGEIRGWGSKRVTGVVLVARVSQKAGKNKHKTRT